MVRRCRVRIGNGISIPSSLNRRCNRLIVGTTSFDWSAATDPDRVEADQTARASHCLKGGCRPRETGGMTNVCR